MYYFIPAWYHAERPWYDNTALWFRVFERVNFDDTVNQIKMFQNAQEPSSLLVLNYQPQLRYYLHKQTLLHVTYWSFFDDIQNISATATHPISFKKLKWPQGTQFIYTPFAIVAKQYNTILAYIHFAENGNLFYIDFQKDNHSEKQYIYDDRGFLSSILYFNEEGVPHYQDYLNEKGTWQVREYLTSRPAKIVINPQADHHFYRTEYTDWEALISERLTLLKREIIKGDDKIVVASHKQHNYLVLNNFAEHQKIFSFFGNRYDVADKDTFAIVKASKLLVVDTETQEKKLVENLHHLNVANANVTRISPFDTRLRLGSSQTLKELIIYFYIDNMTQEQLEKSLLTIITLMSTNVLIELKIITFNRYYDLSTLEKWLIQQIDTFFDADSFFEENDIGENQLEEERELKLKRISLHYFSNEIQIIEALDTARLVIDLGDEPDLYTQIASISAGVPQIHRVHTDYVEHQKNGWVLQDELELEKAIIYYFEGLSNWNASLVYTVQKMADYTSGRILKHWKEQLEKD